MQQFKTLDRCSGTGILEEKHGGKSGSQCNDAVEELRYGEALSVFCQKRNGCVSVLRDAACEKDREWYHSGGKKRYEDKVRTGFRYDSDEGRKQYHKRSVAGNPSVDLNVLQTDSQNKQYSECPDEDSRKMLSDDMVP